MMLERNEGQLMLEQAEPIAEKLIHLHDVVREMHPQVTRISVALYDHATDKVRTFIYSGAETPLNHYQAKLSKCHSLGNLAKTKSARLEQDLSVFKDSIHVHAQKIYEAGYRGSYTRPLLFEQDLLGFIFFNTEQTNAFDDACLRHLDLVADVMGLLIFNSFNVARTMLSTVQSAIDIACSRDPETGAHLQRMSRYSRVIARHIAEREGARDDQFPEYVYVFSALHDIGKVTVPDSILFKPARLTFQEFEVMKTHALAGKVIAHKLLRNHQVGHKKQAEMLLNIIVHHHEAFDGSGYPHGLAGYDIPLEARIVAVADVFDALTSRRPYKEPWSIQRSVDELMRLSGKKLDPACVDALVSNLWEICDIRESFRDPEAAA